MPDISAFAENIWMMPGDDVRMYGIPFTNRTTIIRLQSGGLWVHSPVVPRQAHFEAADALGTVEYLIAPNKIHSLGVEPWKARYPRAEVWLSPDFNKRHPNIKGNAVFGSDTPNTWKSEIDFHVFEGSSFLDEVVFFHKASQSLLVTDLIQKHDPKKQSWFWWAVKKAAGVLGKDGGTGRDLRATFRDRSAARHSRDHIMNWDFNNLIICHGACIKGGAKPVVQEAFSWLGTNVESP